MSLELLNRDDTFIYRVCHLLIHDHDQTLKIVQETFRLLKRSRVNYDTYEKLWVLKNIYIALKKSSRIKPLPKQGTENNIIRKLLLLPAEQRMAIILRDHLEMNYQDIAAIIETSPDHVSHVLNEARLGLLGQSHA